MGARPRKISMLWMVLFVIIAIVGYSFWPKNELGTKESLNILIVGIEGVVTASPSPATPQDTAPFASSIALLSIHPVQKTSHLLLIPGEIVVPPDPSDPFAEFTRGRRVESFVDAIGADSLIKEIERIMNVPVHGTLRTDLLSLRTMVSMVGGLTVPVTVSATGSSSAPTTQMTRLFGEDIVSFVSDQSPGLARLENQARVYQAALAVVRATRRPVHLRGLFYDVYRHFETDMDDKTLFAVAQHLLSTDEERTKLELLPGNYQGEEYVVDTDALGALVSRVYDN